jgi:hypothetical protein
VGEVVAAYGIPVLAIANLDDLMHHLAAETTQAQHVRGFRPAVERYRERYGA